MRGVTLGTGSAVSRNNHGQPGGGDPGQFGGGDPGQFGGGDPGQFGGGDPGQFGGGDPGQFGGGDPGQFGGGDPGQFGGANGQRSVGYGVSANAARSMPVTVVGPVAIAEKQIYFRIQQQEESEWCWAAVAASIEKYFNPESTLKQCNIVNRVLGILRAAAPEAPPKVESHDDRSCGGCDDCKCCCYPRGGRCNTPAPLEVALQSIHRWRTTLDRALRFDELQREIDRGRPVGVGITWASGNSAPALIRRSSDPRGEGHFVALRGYRVLSSGVRQVYVADPLNPSGLVDFDEFREAYYGDGEWTETNLVYSGSE